MKKTYYEERKTTMEREREKQLWEEREKDYYEERKRDNYGERKRERQTTTNVTSSKYQALCLSQKNYYNKRGTSEV